VNKFRGMNDEAGEWVYGYYTKLVEGARIFDAIISDNGYGDLTRFYIHRRETIGQYTGLYDKNGVETYRCDIGNLRFPNGGMVRVVVEWRGYRWVYKTLFALDNSLNSQALNNDPYPHDSPIGSPGYELEVIGNIYEHSELLDE